MGLHACRLSCFGGEGVDKLSFGLANLQLKFATLLFQKQIANLFLRVVIAKRTSKAVTGSHSAL